MALDKFQKVAVAVGVFGLAKKLFFPTTGGKPNTTKPDITFGGELDYRARLQVPSDYLQGVYTNGGQNFFYLQANGGIVFPYTPTITYENTANYTPTSVMHSNFTYYAYKNSAVSPIKVAAKFTVQTDEDAVVYLATSHLLKSLTKMHYGADGETAGAPPPVCRFSAYGDFMMKDVPVVISSFSQDFSPDVDSYVTDPRNKNAELIYGVNFVPTVSTFNLTLLPMYSRNEQANFSVSGFRDTNKLRKGGFL